LMSRERRNVPVRVLEVAIKWKLGWRAGGSAPCGQQTGV
jgi:hypothetical protein